jgi:MoxR-like ATPase
LPPPIYERFRDPQRYDPDQDLLAAVNVALLLGQPLILTGDPGSGKTSLAYWLALQLGLDAPLVQVVRSTTTGGDMLYQFDEVARFRDAQSQVSAPFTDYLDLSPLGKAILLSCDANQALGVVSPARMRAANLLAANRPPFCGDLVGQAEAFAKRRVVLIDELDKAPRDTPNDLLNEIEQMSFDIAQLGVRVNGDPTRRPVVVITSNSEKGLPDAFLRRCVYHHIQTPDGPRLRAIIARRQTAFASRPDQFEEAIALFELLRDQLSRAPGVAELLAWLETLQRLVPPEASSIRDDADRLKSSLAVLAKTHEDLAAATDIALGVGQPSGPGR